MMTLFLTDGSYIPSYQLGILLFSFSILEIAYKFSMRLHCSIHSGVYLFYCHIYQDL